MKSSACVIVSSACVTFSTNSPVYFLGFVLVIIFSFGISGLISS